MADDGRAVDDLGKNATVYNQALEFARQQDFDSARQQFEKLLLAYPHLEKAWISYAQMEKRAHKRTGLPEEAFSSCHSVLQRGLTCNPSSAKLVQAVGLLALQYGKHTEAIEHIERAATMDPACKPVLAWRNFQVAKSAALNAAACQTVQK